MTIENNNKKICNRRNENAYLHEIQRLTKIEMAESHHIKKTQLAKHSENC